MLNKWNLEPDPYSANSVSKYSDSVLIGKSLCGRSLKCKVIGACVGLQYMGRNISEPRKVCYEAEGLREGQGRAGSVLQPTKKHHFDAGSLYQ